MRSLSQCSSRSMCRSAAYSPCRFPLHRDMSFKERHISHIRGSGPRPAAPSWSRGGGAWVGGWRAPTYAILSHILTSTDQKRSSLIICSPNKIIDAHMEIVGDRNQRIHIWFRFSTLIFLDRSIWKPTKLRQDYPALPFLFPQSLQTIRELIQPTSLP